MKHLTDNNIPPPKPKTPKVKSTFITTSYLAKPEESCMKYSVEVDRNTCIACGVCYSTDPSHFESDAVGKSLVVGGTSNGKSKGLFTDELQEDAQRATDSCPTRAISIK